MIKLNKSNIQLLVSGMNIIEKYKQTTQIAKYMFTHQDDWMVFQYQGGTQWFIKPESLYNSIYYIDVSIKKLIKKNGIIYDSIK